MKQVILLFLFSGFFWSTKETPSNSASNRETQQAAFNVLQAKCNVCHRTENPGRIFTEKNMDKLVKKINRQVFVWKRMPKGNEIQLTIEEKESLENWIETLL